MKNLTYTKQTSLVLHTEAYSNAGLKQNEIIEAIKKIDGVWMVNKYNINSNVEVHIKGHSKDYIEDIFDEIHTTLECMLHLKSISKHE